VLKTLFSSAAFKAWVGAASAAGSALAVALRDGVLDAPDMGGIVTAFVLALGFIYRVPNE
jgi:hypothetical protein